MYQNRQILKLFRKVLLSQDLLKATWGMQYNTNVAKHTAPVLYLDAEFCS